MTRPLALFPAATRHLHTTWRAGLLGAALLSGGVSCGTPEAPAERVLLEAGPAVCPDGPTRPHVTIDPAVAVTGAQSNHIAQHQGDVWVVQSFDNVIGRLRGDAYTRDFVDVGNDQNPYDLWVEDGRAYITSSLGHTLTVADASTGEVLRTIRHETFKNPSGVTVTARAIYVTSFDYDPITNTFREGAITVIARDTLEVLGALPATWPNPQFAARVQTPAGERVVIVSTGAVLVRDGVAQLESDAGVEVWTETDDLLAPRRERFALTRQDGRIGAPGRPLPTPDGRALYLTSATAPVLFKLDLARGAWLHDTTSPLRVYDTDSQNTLHHGVIGPRGVLHMTSFNHDALYLWDTTCDRLLAGPADLGVAPTMLEGPHGITLDADGTTAHFVMSHGNVVGRLRYRFEQSNK